MEVAAEYRIDKIQASLNQPYEFVTTREGELGSDEFEYFPQHHYEKSIDRIRERIDDPNLDSLVNHLLESRYTGAKANGVPEEDVPGFVHELLQNDRREELRIEVYPEPSPHSHDHVVDWEYVDWDWNENEWKPIDSFERGDR